MQRCIKFTRLYRSLHIPTKALTRQCENDIEQDGSPDLYSQKTTRQEKDHKARGSSDFQVQ